ETDLTNNQSTATITVLQPTVIKAAETDLAIVKSADPATVGPGGQVNYTLMVTNNGPLPAANVTVQDVLPAGEVFLGANAPGWTLAQDGNVLTFTTPGLPVGF